MNDYDYDLLVIGAGPGGYVAAIRAAQLGLKTACVDKRGTLGGTCLNVGCIPSKALLHASEAYHQAESGVLARMGIGFESLTMDVVAMQKEKQAAVDDLTHGIEFLLKKNKIDWLKGEACFTAHDTVAITEKIHGQNADKNTGHATTKNIRAKNIVIATGSAVASLAGVTVDNDKGIIVDSTGALALSQVPKQMIVIGGGVIGLELGSVWARLGSAVTIIEYLDQILPGMDAEVRKEAARIFKKQGLTLRTATKVTACRTQGKNATLTVESANNIGDGDKNSSDKNSEQLSADVVLLAVGRRPYTDTLGLAAAGLSTNERGEIVVDAHFRTDVSGIWAIGDVTPGAMLAHRAEDEALAVAENIAGQTGIVNHALIPAVVYTAPEIATIGLNEAEAKEQGYSLRVGKFPMMANSRAKTNRDTDGFVKIIADAESDRVLGVHIIASLAGTMIAQVVQAMEFGASSEDIAYTCHAHPTYSEAVKEAAMAVAGKPIHM